MGQEQTFEIAFDIFFVCQRIQLEILLYSEDYQENKHKRKARTRAVFLEEGSGKGKTAKTSRITDSNTQIDIIIDVSLPHAFAFPQISPDSPRFRSFYFFV